MSIMKPIELDSSRQNMKPRPKGLTDDQYFLVALREGYALLEAEAKAKPSVIPPSSKVQDALAQKSDNPYIRARNTILTRMLPSQRSTIEKMEAGTLTKDARYDTFIKQVSELGDKISNALN